MYEGLALELKDQVIAELKQALAEKDREIARWKARSWNENVKFIAEAKENLLKEYIHLTELYGEQKHEIRKLKAGDQLEQQAQQIATLREALQAICSGISRDLLGTTSMHRETMQSIAQQALKEVNL